MIIIKDNQNIKPTLFKTPIIDDYIKNIDNKGMKQTWKEICETWKSNIDSNIDIELIGELYEIGLAHVNKNKKKSLGQYFTPNDVSFVMSSWFRKINGFNICDVACGTGNLILSFFSILDKNEVRNIILERRLFLYDNDSTALMICKNLIMNKYGYDLDKFINDIHCDFLDSNIKLPINAKVISNPPYSRISTIPRNWDNSKIQTKSKELYSSFMEKILNQSQSSVLITPQSFLGGEKYYSLRKMMSNSNGFIVSFDNVPGNVFYGSKKGIFNSNTSNSVRAAITVVENKKNVKGFKISPLIRFKNNNRDIILTTTFLESLLPNKYQVIDKKNKFFEKNFINLIHILEKWKSKSKKNIVDYIVANGKYKMFIPNTCRYFTKATNFKLKRSGIISLSFDDFDVYKFVFCLLNSSFAYFFWRVYDGGITFTKTLLLQIPLFFDLLTSKNKNDLSILFEKMTNENNYVIKEKKNIKIVENIEYLDNYRTEINNILLNILNINEKSDIFNIVHSNNILDFIDLKRSS